MSYLYRRNLETNRFETGFYDAGGKWQPESDHADFKDAAQRTHWLNGGHDDDQIDNIQDRLLNVELTLKQLVATSASG